VNKYLTAITLLMVLAFFSCKENSTEPKQEEFVEHALVLINKNLTFTMGNSWG
jgi:hypothetical protein